MSFATPIISQIGRGGVTFVKNTPLGQTISSQIGNFFKNLGPKTIQTTSKIAKPGIGIGNKVLIGSGIATTGVLALPLGQGGQTGLQSISQGVGNVSKFGSDVTKFFSNNPLVAVGVLIVGGLLVVSLIKK